MQEPYKRKDDLCDAVSYMVRMWPHLPEAVATVVGRDMSKLSEADRRSIERMARHTGAVEKEVTDGGDFYGEAEESNYGVADEFYA
jgi:hypothetical protein